MSWLINPLLHSAHKSARITKNFDRKIRRNHKKNPMIVATKYESVDEKSLSCYVPINDKKNNSRIKGLKKSLNYFYRIKILFMLLIRILVTAAWI